MNWTPTELALLRKLAPTTCAREIAGLIGRTHAAVKNVAFRRGIKVLDPNKLWTREEADKARELRGEGLSGAEIAKRLGRSRSSVMGWLFRNGLLNTNPIPRTKRDHTAQKRGAQKFNARRRAAEPRLLPTPPRAEVASLLPPPCPSDSVSYDDLKPYHCRYPLGGKPYRYCGQRPIEESSYCRKHHEVTHRAKVKPTQGPSRRA